MIELFQLIHASLDESANFPDCGTFRRTVQDIVKVAIFWFEKSLSVPRVGHAEANEVTVPAEFLNCSDFNNLTDLPETKVRPTILV